MYDLVAAVLELAKKFRQRLGGGALEIVREARSAAWPAATVVCRPDRSHRACTKSNRQRAAGKSPERRRSIAFAGEIALRSQTTDTGKAETYFGALSVAREQQAKSWDLRAVMSMARLWRDQGKRDEARELLAPVYGWFTEGFDTRDLKEAKALLGELAS